MAEGIMADLRRDFWIRETGTGQQVAQLHDRYMKKKMIYIYIYIYIYIVRTQFVPVLMAHKNP
jgi:hypothetical protein